MYGAGMSLTRVNDIKYAIQVIIKRIPEKKRGGDFKLSILKICYEGSTSMPLFFNRKWRNLCTWGGLFHATPPKCLRHGRRRGPF